MRITKQYTNRDSQSLDRYLQEIGRVGLLDPQEEIVLAKRIKKGGEDGRLAMERLTKANLRFVVSVAKQYQNQGLPLNDLINEGNLGLIKAAYRFDETRGFKFISYAVWWIRQSILQALAEQSYIVRLPLNQVGTVNKIRNVIEELSQQLERDPTTSEIAERLDLTSKEVEETIKISGRPVSVDAPFQDNDDNSLLDVLPSDREPSPDQKLIAESLQIEVRRALSTLSEREMEVVSLYFGIGIESPLTLEEIGERFNLTRERVRQIKVGGNNQWRHTSRSKSLRTFLG